MEQRMRPRDRDLDSIVAVSFDGSVAISFARPLLVRSRRQGACLAAVDASEKRREKEVAASKDRERVAAAP